MTRQRRPGYSHRSRGDDPEEERATEEPQDETNEVIRLLRLAIAELKVLNQNMMTMMERRDS